MDDNHDELEPVVKALRILARRGRAVREKEASKDDQTIADPSAVELQAGQDDRAACLEPA